MVWSNKPFNVSPNLPPAFLARAMIGVLALALAACSPAEGKKEEAREHESSATAPDREAHSESAPAASVPAAAPEAPTNTAATPQIDEPTDLIALSIVDADGTKWMGSPTRGKKIFRQCTSCHVLEAGQAMIGPSLHAIVGRKAGSEPNFRYSTANKNSHLVWTEQVLFDYLENPRAKVPGTIMSFAGIRKPADRAHLIAFLKNPEAVETPQ